MKREFFSSGTALRLPLQMRIFALMLVSVLTTALTASATITYPGITGATFLYGNSGVNAVGQSTFVTAQNGGWGYRYFVPVNYDPAIKYPVIFFLHGLGEKGTNDTSQMTAGGNTANGALGIVASMTPQGVNNQTAYPCFFVLPQYPNGQDWDALGGAHADITLNNIITTLNTFYSIDLDRIAITGLSEGGFGTWNLPSETMQNVFSCAIPVSSQPHNIFAFPDHLAVWAFHAADDGSIPVGGSDSAIDSLRGRGLKEMYTRYNTGGHSTQTWQSAYLTPGLLPWIFAQRRGQPMQGVIGTSPNLLITGSNHGTTLNFSAVAPSDATTVGWLVGNTTITSSPTAGILSNSVWTMSNLALTNGGFQLYQALAVLPGYGVNNNGGYTTINMPYPIAYVAPTGDTTPPTIAISSPTLTSGSFTTNSALTISGTASDDVAVTSVTWTSSIPGFSGTANGTTSWSIANIPLVFGNNRITVTAKDAKNNVATAVADIYYTGTSANQPPAVSAGIYKTITLPTATTTLAGTVSDDGLPSNSVTTTWSEISGPGAPVQFSNVNSLTSTATFSQEGTYVLQLSATDTALISTSTVVITVQPPTTYTVAKAINCGGTSYTSPSTGIVYSADTNFSGGNTNNTNASIGGTSDLTLYQFYRFGTVDFPTITYNIPSLTNGNYDVILKFIEPSQVPQIVGMRTMNIKVQGTTVVTGLDVYARAGVFNAYDQVIPGVVVSNGTLQIVLSGVVGFPSISGILVRAVPQVAPSISGGSPPGGSVGTGYSFSYTVSGTPPPTCTITTGALPPGLTISSSGAISGTPTLAGVYTGTVQASNGVGSPATANFNMTITGTYTQWANYYGVGGPTEIPQGDAVTNLIKYLSDINPNGPMSASDLAKLPTAGTTTISGTPYLTLTYHKNASAPALTVVPQGTTDLVNWNLSPDLTQNLGTDSLGDSIIQYCFVMDTAKKFVRLQVITP